MTETSLFFIFFFLHISKAMTMLTTHQCVLQEKCEENLIQTNFSSNLPHLWKKIILKLSRETTCLFLTRFTLSLCIVCSNRSSSPRETLDIKKINLITCRNLKDSIKANYKLEKSETDSSYLSFKSFLETFPNSTEPEIIRNKNANIKTS